MREFFKKLCPISNASFLSIGIILCEIIFRFYKLPFNYLIILHLVALFLYLSYNKKIFFLILGIILFFQISSYKEFEEKRKTGVYLQENDIGTLQNRKKKSIIEPVSQIKKGYYLANFKIGSYISPVPLRIYSKKEELLKVQECYPEFIKVKKPDPAFSGDYFTFLNDFNGFYLQVSVNKCETLSTILDERKFFRNRIEKILENGKITDYPEDISMGLIFGDSGYLNSEFKARAREGGILHLFAASGLHIGVLTGFLFLICKRLPFLNFYTEKIIPLVIGFIYLYMLSFPVSLVRAFLFTSFFLIGSFFFRKMKSADLILISSAIIAVFDRENFLSLSFNLSYSAACGILFFKEHMDKLFFPNRKNFFTENITISLSASLGTYPVLLYYFHSFSYGSVLINLLLVPLTTILLPCLYVSVFFGSIDYFLQTLSINSNLIFEAIKQFYNEFIQLFWVYSEILLRLLAFLSDITGETIGFYKESGENIRNHIYLYILYFFWILLGIFLSYHFINKNQKLLLIETIAREIKNKYKKFYFFCGIFLSIFAFIGTILFYTLGYFLEEKNSALPKKNIYAGSDYYLVKEENVIFLGGNCTYSGYQIKNALLKICTKELQSIHIEKESCLYLSKICQKKSFVKFITIHKEKLKIWENLETDGNSFPRFFNKNKTDFLVFYPNSDSLDYLFQNTKSGGGKILLLFPYRSKDSVTEWNRNKNVLGVGKNWEFITPDEL